MTAARHREATLDSRECRLHPARALNPLSASSAALAFTLRFPAPGFFIGDATLTVWLDGQVFYQGSFTSGFEYTVQLAPGPHQVVTQIEMGFIRRSKTYTLHLQPAAHTVATLAYSRFWGNFKSKLTTISQ